MKKIDKPLYIHLGQSLKEARLRKGYSLQEVADMVGKSKVSIKRYEDAATRIDMNTLEVLCNVLGVEPSRLYISSGDRFEERILLDPVIDHEPEQKEDGTINKADLSKEMFDKFMKLEEESKRIVLMMLHMKNIDEILEQIK